MKHLFFVFTVYKHVDGANLLKLYQVNLI